MKEIDYEATLKRCFSIILVCLLLLGAVIWIPSAYASLENDYVTILITGHATGNIEPIFKSNGVGSCGPWYPGYSASNTLRIKNQYGKKVSLNRIGMTISLERNGEKLDYNDNNDALAFMNNMKIKVEHKKLLGTSSGDTIFDGNFAEFNKGKDCSIPIGNNDYIDLLYTISMDKSVTEPNISGIVGQANFTVNVIETDIGNSGYTYSGGGSAYPLPKPEDNKPKDEEEKDPASDIGNHWARNVILELLKSDIIDTYPDGTIQPDKLMNRAEAAVLVGKALGLEDKKNGYVRYKDELPDWARGYIVSTSELRIFRGYSARQFNAYKNITREEITTALVRAFDKKLNGSLELKFKDKKRIAKWAVFYVKAGIQNNVIEGYPDNTFRPKGYITRAEAFTLIYKLLNTEKNNE